MGESFLLAQDDRPSLSGLPSCASQAVLAGPAQARERDPASLGSCDFLLQERHWKVTATGM